MPLPQLFRPQPGTSASMSRMITSSRHTTSNMPRKLSRTTSLLILALLTSSNQINAQYIDSTSRHHTRANLSNRQDQGSTSLYVVSHDNFCVYGPREGGRKLWEMAQDVVSYCTTDQHNTLTIPEGTLHGVTYVKTPNYVQVSGTGDFTKINIAGDDLGAQFDSVKHTPQGAQVFLSDDNSQTASNWVTLISSNTFCVRACTGDAAFCPTEYDELGCWFVTSNAVGWEGVWQDCDGDDGNVPGVVDGQTYTVGQGDMPTPTPPPVYNCRAGESVGGGNPAGPTGGDSPSPTSPGAESGPTPPPEGNKDEVDGSKPSEGGESGSPSTSWVPVETCKPCEGGAASSSAPSSSDQGSAASPTSTTGASSGSAPPAADNTSSTSSTSSSLTLGGTTQVGVTQLNGSGSTSPPGAGPTTPPAGGGSAGGGGDLLEKRDEHEGGGSETITKDGQCCFTTWTPSVVGGPTSTSSGDNASNTGAGAGAGNKGNGNGDPNVGSGNSTTPGASGSGNGTSPGIGGGNGNGTSGNTSSTGLSIGGSNAAATPAIGGNTTLSGNATVGGLNSSLNGTNGTGGALGRVDMSLIGISGSLGRLGRGVIVGGIGVVIGGWSLI